MNNTKKTETLLNDQTLCALEYAFEDTQKVLYHYQLPYPGMREIYFSICVIGSIFCGVVGLYPLALRKYSLAARNSRLVIIM